MFTNSVSNYSGNRFRGGSNKANAQAKNPSGLSNGSQSPSPTSPLPPSQSSSSLAPRVPPLPNSPSLSQTLSMEGSGGVDMNNSNDVLASYNLPRPKPLWLNPAYAKHIVKGNFMTLSARPKTVEPGEWLAHQGMLSPCCLSKSNLTRDLQLSNTTAICGTLCVLFMRKRRMERVSAMLRPALRCPPARKLHFIVVDDSKEADDIKQPFVHLAQLSQGTC